MTPDQIVREEKRAFSQRVLLHRGKGAPDIVVDNKFGLSLDSANNRRALIYVVAERTIPVRRMPRNPEKEIPPPRFGDEHRGKIGKVRVEVNENSPTLLIGNTHSITFIGNHRGHGAEFAITSYEGPPKVTEVYDVNLYRYLRRMAGS